MSENVQNEPKVKAAKTADVAPKSASDFERMSNATGELLSAQPKRPVRLRKAGKGEQHFVQVWVNGYGYEIARGIEVDVPQTVYDILSEAGEI